MSLVQVIISDSFLLVCGDQRACLANGQINENFIKVFKLNKNIVIGIAGDISDNLKLFNSFIHCDNQNKRLISSTNCELSLNEFMDIIVKRFTDLKKTPHFNTHSVVCGWNGEKFVGHTFYSSTGISDVIPLNKNDVQIISSGVDKHYQNFMHFKNKYPFGILGVKNTFKDVLEAGVKFDKTINKTCTFELLRKSDFT